MVHTALIAAGTVLPSTRKKVVSPTYALLSRKMQEKQIFSTFYAI